MTGHSYFLSLQNLIVRSWSTVIRQLLQAVMVLGIVGWEDSLFYGLWCTKAGGYSSAVCVVIVLQSWTLTSLILLGPLAIRCDAAGLAKLPIGALTTLLFGQLSHPRTGGPIKQLGLGAEPRNHQSSSVAQNCHYDSLKTCSSNCKAALASAHVSAPCSHVCR